MTPHRAIGLAIGLLSLGLHAARAQDDHVRRIYWVLDTSGYHFDPDRTIAYRGDTLRFLVKSGPPHSLTFDSTAIPVLAKEPLRRLMAALPRTSDEPFATRDLENVGETINIPTDSLPPGIYSFYCEDHDDEEGLIDLRERPGAGFADYFESSGVDDSASWPASGIDSLVLQRTACSSGCAAYRLSVDKSGAVLFARTDGGGAAPATETVARAQVLKLFGDAAGAGMFALPLRMQGDQQLCPITRGGRPTLIITIYRKAIYRRVEYNTGCLVASPDHGLVTADPLVLFARWGSEIDTAVGVTKWIH